MEPIRARLLGSRRRERSVRSFSVQRLERSRNPGYEGSFVVLLPLDAFVAEKMIADVFAVTSACRLPAVDAIVVRNFTARVT